MEEKTSFDKEWLLVFLKENLKISIEKKELYGFYNGFEGYDIAVTLLLAGDEISSESFTIYIK